MDEKANVVYYRIKICLFGLIWEVKKRYSEFRELYLSLSQSHISLPNFPPKTMVPLSSEIEIKLRMIELEVFIKVKHFNKKLFLRLDLFNSLDFHQFLQVIEIDLD